MMPSLVGSKRLREDFEDDLAQIRVSDLTPLMSQLTQLNRLHAHRRTLFCKHCLDTGIQTLGSRRL